MKRIKGKFKRALVLVLSVAMVCNTVDMSMLKVYAESATAMEQGNDAEGNVSVSNNESSTISENHSNTVSAGNGEEVYPQSGVLELDEYKGAFMLPSVETSAVSMSLFSLRTGAVDKISGTAVDWIDRLDLTGDEYKFARELYNNLEEWTDNDGVEDLLIEDSYYADGELVKEVVSVTLTGADLEETAQNVYDQLALHIPYVRAVYDAFDRDYPEVFWLSGNAAYSYSEVTYTTVGDEYQCTASLGLVLKGQIEISEGELEAFDMRQSAYQSQAAIEAAIASRDAAVATIITDEIREQSADKQIAYFNDTLTKTNQYNTIVGNSVSGQVPDAAWECISALAGKTGTEGPVCEGYARAFKVLCDQVGIPCVLVDGNAVASNTSGPHMWNYVQVDGDWYAMDVTWNDPILSENSGALSGGECVKWSLVGSDTVVNDMKFIESHPVSNTASPNGVVFDNGPVLSAEKYTNYVASVNTDSGAEVMYEDIKEAFDVANRDSMGATLKLLKSVKLRDGYTITGEFTLDLNGCILDLGESTLYISSETTETSEGCLTIKDSSVSGASTGTGRITSCLQNAAVIENSGTLMVLSGTIEATEAGEYTGNYAILNRAILEMSGGLLTTNAWHGVGIVNFEQGQVTVTDGVVQGSTHTESESINAYGIDNSGALIIAGTPGINGGGDSAGISHVNGSFKLSGAPSIQGSVEFGDICLAVDTVMTITDALTDLDSYSVYTYGGLVVFAVPGTDYTISEADKARFTSARGFDISRNSEGELVFSHLHEGVSFDKVWDIYSGDVATGNYVLGGNIWSSGALKITGDVTLCLNGFRLRGDLTIAEGATLTICDCSADGTGLIEGTISNLGILTLKDGTIDAEGGANGVFMDYGSVFMMDGGTIRNAICGVDVSEDATFTMSGGIIQNCTTSGVLNDGYMTMTGGTIQDCATNGVTGGFMTSGVMVMLGGTIQDCGFAGVSGVGSFMLTGGTISGKQGIRVGDMLSLSGEPVINGTEVDILLFNDGSTISVAGVLSGADIYSVKIEEQTDQDIVDLTGVIAVGDVQMNADKFTVANTYMVVELNAENNQLLLDYIKGDMPISIIWEDEENIHNTRPGTMEIEIYANDVYVQTVYVTEEESWKYTLKDKYLYDTNGAIIYDVKLYDPIGVYSGTPGASEDGFVIIASLNHMHELYLSQSSYGETDTQWVEILCADSEDASCDWSGGEYCVTINGPDNLIYDGSVKTASIVDSITDRTGLATISNIAYYVKNGNTWTAVTEAVDAGTYKAEVTVTMGSDTLAAWVEFEIMQLDAASYVDVVPYAGEYDPFAVNGVEAVRVDILHPEMDATIEYSTDGGSHWSTTVPVMSSVGSLEVMVKVTAPNFTEYTKTVTAVMTPFELSTCSVGLEQHSYYYTGQQIKPVVTEITDYLDRELPLTEADYKITYGDNNSVEQPGYVYVEAMNPNYTGMSQMNFSIGYYDAVVEVLYNGAEKSNGYYNADVAISAEGYTVSKTIDGPYTEAVMLSGEDWVEMLIYFKQDGTGYITSATPVSVSIDNTAPSFEGENLGILVGEHDWWNSLAERITYDVYYKEAQECFIVADDILSGVNPLEIYYYIDRSGSETVKTEEELDGCEFVPVVTEEDTEAAGGSMENGSVAGNGSDGSSAGTGSSADDSGTMAGSGSSSSGDGTGGDFCIEEDGRYVIYAYVVDHAGNKSDYICTNGIVLDTKTPAVAPSVPSEEAGTLTDTGMTFTIESDEDAIAVLEIQQVTDTTAGDMIVDSGMTENGFAYLESLASDTQIEMGSSEGAKYFYKVELSPGEEKAFTLSELSPNETYTYVIWVFDKAHNLNVIGEELSEEEIRTISVTTLKTIPTFDADPTITGTYGDKLSEMTVSQPASTNGIPGTWSIVYETAGQLIAMPAVNGTTAYTVSFTPEDTDAYETVTVQVVPTVAKLPLTVMVDEQFRVYGEENPELTYTITEGSIVDANYAGRPRLSIELSTTATKNSDAGEYDITGTVTNDVNYEVTVLNGTLIIDRAQAVIMVAEGAESYDKTFGDEGFYLSGISTNSDGIFTYETGNNQVADVDANGKVTINGAGHVWIMVRLDETKNYTSAEPVEISVNVERAVVEDVYLSRDYLYLKDNQENIDLTAYVPADAGEVWYEIVDTRGDCEFAQAPTVTNGKLSYTVKAGENGDSTNLRVSVGTDNYESFVVNVTVTLVDRIPVVEQKVSLKNTLTYGDALSKLEFAEAVFVAEGTEEVVTGTIAWEIPDFKPDVATTKATWVFTPDSNEYLGAIGEIDIVVEKAEYPEMTIVVVKPTAYGENGYLAVEGAFDTSEVTLTVPENNGVVKEIKQASDSFEIVAENAGTVIVTATAKDTTGNYKDGTATYELTVAPAQMKTEWISWAEGFDGAVTYTGDALVPNVVVQNGTVTLVQGQDYTVEYNNNEFAYTLKEGDAGYDVTKAPKAVVIGKGNYAGEAKLCFVINKAENAPNMPKDTRTVANSVAMAGQVSLPADWVWQNADQTLAAGTVSVAIAVYNGADKGNYVNEAVSVSITRLEAGIPFVTEINGEDVEIIENGWEYVSEELEESEEGDEITVDMNGVTILPGNVIEQIKGKNIMVVLEMGNGVEWSINGKTIITEEVPDVDLGVELNTTNIPVDVINTITDEIFNMQISLAHNGEFGYTAVLCINLDAENAGYYAQLFHYEETEKLLKFVQEDIINDKGFAELPFTHASEYTIVIDEEAYKAPGTDSGNGGNAGTTTPIVPEPTPGSTSAPESTLAPVGKPEATSPLTGDNTVDWVALMAVVSLAVAMGTGYRRRKGRIK